VIGEGGVHLHRLAAPTETVKDGAHKHLFFIGDRLLMTDLSGDHLHMISHNSVAYEEMHNHTVTIQTGEGPVQLKCEGNSGHTHELQTETTTLSGLHVHFLVIPMEDGMAHFVSVLPADLIAAIQENVKAVPALKNFKIAEDNEHPLEMDFQLVKRLNKSDFKDVMIKSAFQAVVKGFSRLKDGLQVESLVLSRERFFDLGVATRFVLDAGLAINGAEERPESYFFNVRAKERFDEPTLQRIRLTDGVEAVVGLLLEDEISNQEGTIEADINELTDRNKEEEGLAEMKDLHERFNVVMSMFGDDDIPVVATEEGETSTVKSFEILKRDEERRLVFGPVLIPENFDLQEDIIGEDEIENASHNYMIKHSFQNDPEFLESIGLNTRSERGYMHTEFNRKLAVVESYIAPVNFEMNGRPIKKGTWVAVVKVFDDEVWNLVKAGRITGFSIGGRSRSIPVEG